MGCFFLNPGFFQPCLGEDAARDHHHVHQVARPEHRLAGLTAAHALGGEEVRAAPSIDRQVVPVP